MEVFTTCGAGGHGERDEKEGEKEMGEKKGKTGERESKATLIASSYKHTHHHQAYLSPNGHTPISANGHNWDMRREREADVQQV